jgi:hypothetical protein
MKGGTRGQQTECALLNVGTFAALRSLGVQSIYSGHDHTNDFVGTWLGVRLAYGRKTGSATKLSSCLSFVFTNPQLHSHASACC